ncbi:DAZ-associated 1-like isoform X3 [Brachionus plicatilis]|uniref:DAZ-associated 1-like isoform X3 n=1 Tax=Brachionus plicatilis TaxID=10195 RepID=A0A3M7QXT2_BRAPC|nr:DAZ-associated 1-like isoform X3 [Brachionus plicatilis]
MDVVNFFSRYGNVIEFKMMYDESKQKPRGFGFITFELEESAIQVLKQQYFQFNGKQIEVKPQNHNVKQKQQFPQSFNQNQQMYMNNWNNQRGANWNSQPKTNWRSNFHMQGQYQGQQCINSGYPSGNNPSYPVQPQSNWNNFNFYGQNGSGHGQTNGYFDGNAALSAATGYSS